MLEPITQQCAGPSKLNAHLPSDRRRVDSSDEDEPERPVWAPRRLHLKFDNGDYQQKEDTEQKPPIQRIEARRCDNLFIDSEVSVVGDGNNDKESDDKNNKLDGFIVADDMES